MRLALGDLPAACVADDVWPASVAASLGALLGLAEVDGAVDLTALERSRQLARYTMAWTPRPRR
jgi:hypothetical protein